MVKAVIADVDGVMVGKQEGVNFPLPHTAVIQSLEHLSSQGIPIILCTAKFGFAIKEIAIRAKLHTPHITDGGAVIVDWVDDKIISVHPIDKSTALAYTQASIEKNIYTELYTVDHYFIQSSQKSDFTQKRTKVLQSEPQLVESLTTVPLQHDIIKIISFTEDSDGSRLQKNIEQFGDRVAYIWSQHPYLYPRLPMVITSPGVSKQHAVKEVATYLDIPLDSVLGIGDSEADWSFMQECGYVATIGQEGGQLQNLSKTKGEGHYFFGLSVDKNGLLGVFDHFEL